MEPRPTVLIVDDNPDILLFSRAVLERAGYHVQSASSAAEARAVLATERPGLVLLDVMMEEVDAGFALARELATRPDAPPVVLVSQFADAAARTFDTTGLGVRRVLNKPLSPQRLLTLAADLLPLP